jgi:HEAT repeat protein
MGLRGTLEVTRRGFARDRGLWLLVCAGLVVGCAGLVVGCAGPSGAVRSAYEANLESLRREIERERRAGTLDEHRARAIARAVLERELASADEDALPRIRALRSCAPPLYEALQVRAETPDSVGAEAAMILLEDGKLRGSPLESYGASERGAWRAVAARDTQARAARSQRLAYFLDPDERVRRAALHSAVAAPDARDAEALLEVSRVDPDPMARSLAIRALGRLGGERTVLALKDRWERADEELRLAIVDAWAQPKSWKSGGRTQLLTLVEGGSGAPALSAAAALLRTSDPARESALQKLLSGARDGSTEERRLALRLLPPGLPGAREALRTAGADPDPEVRVLANARLLDIESTRAEAQKTLRHMAQGRGSAALQARAALAAFGDSSVAPKLREELAEERSSHRKVAALGLLRLGRPAEAAVIFADESPAVRTEVACQWLGRR